VKVEMVCNNDYCLHYTVKTVLSAVSDVFTNPSVDCAYAEVDGVIVAVAERSGDKVRVTWTVDESTVEVPCVIPPEPLRPAKSKPLTSPALEAYQTASRESLVRALAYDWITQEQFDKFLREVYEKDVDDLQ